MEFTSSPKGAPKARRLVEQADGSLKIDSFSVNSPLFDEAK